MSELKTIYERLRQEKRKTKFIANQNLLSLLIAADKKSLNSRF